MLQLLSPAKINLFLHLVGQRDDGYHELSSLFQTISLFDTISISHSSQDQITCSNSSIPANRSNLAWRAVEQFREKTKILSSITIHLEKRIPTEAGLGGGSSNAATVLWGLNTLFKQPVTTDELMKIGAQLGSDVAFFFSLGTAYCTGRGEHVEAIPMQTAQTVWIVKPNKGLVTAEVYKRVNLSNKLAKDPENCLQKYLNGKLDCYNDLEEAAFSIMPELKTTKENLLQQGFSQVVLSGSGSALFCLGEAFPQVDQNYFISQEKFVTRPIEDWYY